MYSPCLVKSGPSKQNQKQKKGLDSSKDVELTTVNTLFQAVEVY